MTPLSDTHARARKLKDVIDKRVRARVSKQIALPVPMSRKVFFKVFFIHFFHAHVLVTFLTIFGTKMEAKMFQNGTQKLHYSETCFFTRFRYQNTSFWDPRTLKFMLLARARCIFTHFHVFSYFSQKCQIFVSKMASFWYTWTT